MKFKIKTKQEGGNKMGNPFTMMDEYHQRYWQNYDYSSRDSERVRSEAAHDITKRQAEAEGFRDPYALDSSREQSD